MDDALGLESEIVLENGRWAVYLVIVMWNSDGSDSPMETVRRRIADYATRADAEMARGWMHRSADRERPFRSQGF